MGFVHMYKIQVQVKDCSGFVSIVLFDREVVKLLKISAFDLLQSNPPEMEPDTFLEKLNEVVKKQFAICVDTTDYNLRHRHHVYTISKISDDPRLLASVEDVPEDAEVPEHSMRAW